MDVFFNPIFTRESNPPQQRTSQPAPLEKMSFQPNGPEEKFTFNPQKQTVPIQPSKESLYQNNFQYKYEEKRPNTEREEQILVDMSLQSSSLNNTSMLSVDQSKLEKNFFRNPLYLDNSYQKKIQTPVQYEQEERRDYYPAYEDFQFSADKNKKEEYLRYEKNNKSQEFELKMVDFNQNSVDVSKNHSNISNKQYDYDQKFSSSNNYNYNYDPSYKNSVQNKVGNANPGTLMSSLETNQKSSVINDNYAYKTSNYLNENKYYSEINQNNKANTPNYPTIPSTKQSNLYFDTPKFEENDLFKKTAEFKDLGFISQYKNSPSNTNNTYTAYRSTYNKESSYPTTQNKTPPNIINNNHINNNYNSPTIIEKNTILSPGLSRSYNEIEEKSIYLDVSHLKDKVVSTLSKYKEQLTTKQPNSIYLERDYQEINKEYSQILEKYSNLTTSHIAESGFMSASNLSYLKTGGPNENEINNMMELVQEFLDKFQPKPISKKPLEKFPNEPINDQVPVVNTVKKMEITGPIMKKSMENQNIYREKSEKFMVDPLSKIDEIRRQRKHDELEQSFLTIQNNITAYDLDRTRNFTDFSYLSEVSMLAPNEKTIGKQKLPILINNKTSNKRRIFGFLPKNSRFVKTKEDFSFTHGDFEDIPLICERCNEIFKSNALKKHQINCFFNYNSMKQQDFPESQPTNIREIQFKVDKVINKLHEKASQYKNYLEKDFQNRLFTYINLFMSQKTQTNLDNIIKVLMEIDDSLNKISSNNSVYLTFSIIRERLLMILRSKSNKIDKIADNSQIFCVNIESDEEENSKNTKENNMAMRYSINPPRNTMSFKKKNEPNQQEEIKNYFFTEAINLKFALPLNHPFRDILISDLYEEALKQKIPVEEFRKFIDMRIKSQ